ncbi:uncharacterized protein AAGF69_003586 isoform 1-T3 [Amazona ochrocephala]
MSYCERHLVNLQVKNREKNCHSGLGDTPVFLKDSIRFYQMFWTTTLDGRFYQMFWTMTLEEDKRNNRSHLPISSLCREIKIKGCIEWSERSSEHRILFERSEGLEGLFKETWSITCLPVPSFPILSSDCHQLDTQISITHVSK